MALLALPLAVLGAVAVSAQPDPSTMKEIAPGVFLPILNLVHALMLHACPMHCQLEHDQNPFKSPTAT